MELTAAQQAAVIRLVEAGELAPSRTKAEGTIQNRTAGELVNLGLAVRTEPRPKGVYRPTTEAKRLVHKLLKAAVA